MHNGLSGGIRVYFFVRLCPAPVPGAQCLGNINKGGARAGATRGNRFAAFASFRIDANHASMLNII